MEKTMFEVWLAVNDDGDATVSLEGASALPPVPHGLTAEPQ